LYKDENEKIKLSNYKKKKKQRKAKENTGEHTKLETYNYKWYYGAW